MDPTIRAIFFLVAVILATLSALGAEPRQVRLFPWCWDAFEAA